MIGRDAIVQDVVELLTEITGDWEFRGEIQEDSMVLEGLGLESIDIVALCTGVEERYGRSLHFVQFVADVQEHERGDFTVGQFSDFVEKQLGPAVPASR